MIKNYVPVCLNGVVIMENEDSVLCTGCLCVGRKMLIVDDYWKKKCFLQIMSEVPMTPDERAPVWLCWECDASIARFTRFKSQVVESLKIFRNYIDQNLDLADIKRSPTLRTEKVSDIAIIPPDATLPFFDGDVKTEIDSESERAVEVVVKVERDEGWEEFNAGSNAGCIAESNAGSNAGSKAGSKAGSNAGSNAGSDAESDDDRALAEVAKKRKVRKAKRRRKVEVVYEEVLLDSAQVEEERREMASREEYVNAMFRCESCITTFPNADDLKDHVRLKHELNASGPGCPVCGCTFATDAALGHHAKRHALRYRCLECGRHYRSKAAAGKHHAEAHRSLDFDYGLGDGLDERLEEAPEAEGDSNSNAHSATYPCEFCTKTFRWKTSLRKHLEKHRIETGQKRRPYCEPCRLSFTTSSNLQKHVKTSSKHQIQLKLRKLNETLGQDGASAEGQLDRIKQMKRVVNSERQRYACTQCDRRFQWRGNLLRHLHSHDARAKGELVCEPCKRTFSSIATYQQHMKFSRKHVSENDFKYVCSDCGKRFANKTRLQDHVDWEHLKNFVHACQVCQKVFKSHTSLYMHKQFVHKKDVAAHLCDHCGKPFTNQAKLRAHVTALHSLEAPYRCAACPARFSWHSCLSRHVKKVHRRPEVEQN